jgi:hypothetical protein
VPTIVERVVSHGNLGFLDWTFKYSYLLSCTHEAEWTPVPDQLLLRKAGSTGNGTRTSGPVARNSDHYTTEAVNLYIHHSFLLCEESLKVIHGNEKQYM